MESVEIDSVMMSGAGNIWFPTPGWTVAPGETDSFDFPSYPIWPVAIKIAAFITGEYLVIDIIRPEQDSWYFFQPPHEQVRVKFTGYTGIEERNSVIPDWRGATMFVNNNILNRNGLLNSGEIVNSSGQIVRSLPLAPGVYFYRPKNKLAPVCRLVLIR